MASSAAYLWADRRIQLGGESPVPVEHRREALLRWRRLSLYLRSVTAFREILQERRLFGVEKRAADVDKGVIHPHHPFFRFWDLLLFLCTTYNVLFIPIRLCFRTSGDSADVAVAYTTDIVYLIDIVIRFRTGFMFQGYLIQNLKEIRRQYVRGGLALDLVSLTPADVVAYAAGADRLTVAMLRLPRLLRVVRIPGYFNHWERTLAINLIILRFARLGFWIWLIGHWVGCLWFAVGRHDVDVYYSKEAELGVDARGWVHEEALLERPISFQYVRSVYWAITTLTTVGYGDIHPYTELETMYGIVVMLIGQAIYAFIIGNMSSLIADADAVSTSFRRRLDTVTAYMRYRQLPDPLQRRIMSYYEYKWASHRGMDENAVLEMLPSSLRVELQISLNRHVFEKIPIFKGAPESFMAHVFDKLVAEVASPGDFVLMGGEFNNRLIIVVAGELEVVPLDLSDEIDETADVEVVEKGDYVGEEGLLFEAKSSYAIRAASFCDLLTLSTTDFQECLHLSPYGRDHLEKFLMKVGMIEESGSMFSPAVARVQQEMRDADGEAGAS